MISGLLGLATLAGCSDGRIEQYNRKNTPNSVCTISSERNRLYAWDNNNDGTLDEMIILKGPFGVSSVVPLIRSIAQDHPNRVLHYATSLKDEERFLRLNEAEPFGEAEVLSEVCNSVAQE